MDSTCLDCGTPIDHRRKRCHDCAYQHHKDETVRQRRERTAVLWGPRDCTSCGVRFEQEQREVGSPRQRCPACHGYQPVPEHPCVRCHVQMVPGRRKYCDRCLPLHQAEQAASYRKPVVRTPCTVCGTPCLKTVCGPCGQAARRREASRLRSFRDRLLTSIVHTSEDVEFILALLDAPCEYCGSTTDITIEHRIPLIRGGAHDKSNLTSACRSCNSSKQNKTPEEWSPDSAQHRENPV